LKSVTLKRNRVAKSSKYRRSIISRTLFGGNVNPRVWSQKVEQAVAQASHGDYYAAFNQVTLKGLWSSLTSSKLCKIKTGQGDAQWPFHELSSKRRSWESWM